jgi:hypothetical protein
VLLERITTDTSPCVGFLKFSEIGLNLDVKDISDVRNDESGVGLI